MISETGLLLACISIGVLAFIAGLIVGTMLDGP